MVSRSNNKLKQLNLNPLSVAKYFYQKGIDDYRLMQDMIYLSYREILKKEGVILFKEKFQAWEDCPVLESVFQEMKRHYKEHGTMDCLFDPVEEMEDKTIKTYLAKVYRNFQTAKKKGDIDFFFLSEDEAWEQAREKVNGERRPHIFIEPREIIVPYSYLK